MDIFSPMHMVILLIIVLLIFGPTKLPQLARSIGRSVRELKEGMNEINDAIKKPGDPPTPQPPTQVATPQLDPVKPVPVASAQAKPDEPPAAGGDPSGKNA